MLLMGDVGAGQNEFAYTSAAKLSIAKRSPEDRKRIIDPYYRHIKIPEKTCYLSFSKSKKDIMREVYVSFNEEYYEAFKANLIFKDFSSLYFKHSIVPSSWARDDGSFFTQEEGGSLLENLIEFLDEEGKNSLIIIDSLTDLLTSAALKSEELVYILKGLQRASKRWYGMVYLLLTKGIAGESKERLISDIVDGVLVFEWQKSRRYSHQKRYMYVGKFTGVLPHISRAKISRFGIEITGKSGLVVVDTERIY